MDSDIDLLKKQVLSAHERIERLSKENWEFRMLVRAMMLSHHDKKALAKEIESEKEHAVSIGLGDGVSDPDIQFFQDKADRAIALVFAHARGQL